MTAVAFPHATAGVDSSRSRPPSPPSPGASHFDSLVDAGDGATQDAPPADPRASAHRATPRQADTSDPALVTHTAMPVPIAGPATDATAALAGEPPPVETPPAAPVPVPVPGPPAAAATADMAPAVTVAAEIGQTPDHAAPSGKPARPAPKEPTDQPAAMAAMPPVVPMAPPPIHPAGTHGSIHEAAGQPRTSANADPAPVGVPLPPAAASPATPPAAQEAAAAMADTPTQRSAKIDDNALSANFDTLQAAIPPAAPAPATPGEPAPAARSPVMAETQRQVAVRIGKAAKTGEDTLTIELHPADLGHVAVRLAFHATGVDVQMVVARKETYDAFMQDRASMEQQLSQAGIDLGSGGLNLQYGAPSDRPAPFLPANGSAGGPSAEPAPDIMTHALRPGHGLVNIIA